MIKQLVLCQLYKKIILLTDTMAHGSGGLTLTEIGGFSACCDASQGVVRQGPTRGRQETIEPPAGPYIPLGRIHEHQYIPHYRCTVAGPWTAYTRKTHLMPPALTHSIYPPHQTHIHNQEGCYSRRGPTACRRRSLLPAERQRRKKKLLQNLNAGISVPLPAVTRRGEAKETPLREEAWTPERKTPNPAEETAPCA